MRNYYSGKRVFITGHTGFKGSWLTAVLLRCGAEVTGYSLEPPTDPSLFALSGLGREIRSIRGDIRDLGHLEGAMEEARPEVVFHLAAQPIVRRSYSEPVLTYETNVLGTVNLLEAVRRTGTAESVVNVTTDKVYYNDERAQGFRETDTLCGRDPYSNSKSCSELVTAGYRESFFRDAGLPVSTARAGNVIGGGDYAEDRIIPDCVRAAGKGEPVRLRSPGSVRPYQHVLEPVHAYLLLAEMQAENPEIEGAYNIGPGEADMIRTGELADAFCRAWGDGARWESAADGGPREAGVLRLDCSRARDVLGWSPVWDVREAVRKTVEFEKERIAGGNPLEIMMRQIAEHERGL